MHRLRETIWLAPGSLALAWFVEAAGSFWNNRPDLEFGWVALLFSLYLWHDLWRPARTTPAPGWKASLLVFASLGWCGLAFVELFRAAFGWNPAAMWATAISCGMIIAANLRSRYSSNTTLRMGAVLCLPLFALPLPSLLHAPLIHALQTALTHLNLELLGLAGIPAERSGTLISLSGVTVGIDEACSGIRSLQSILFAAAALGLGRFKEPRLALGLILLAPFWALAGNLARSLLLCLAAHHGGESSVERWHDPAGWGVFLISLAGIGITAWAMNALRMASTAPTRTSRTETPTL